MIRLLGFDLDGTLTDGRKEITPRTRRALDGCSERGIALALASGRPLLGMLRVAEELELRRLGGYLVAYNGAQIYDCAAGRIIAERCIPKEIAPLVCEAARACGAVPVTYDEGGIVAERIANRYVQQESYNNRLTARQVKDVSALITHDVPKLMLAGEPGILTALRPKLAERLAGKADVYFSERWFLEIMPPGTDKGSGLAQLCGLIGAVPAEIMAFGDGMNDIPMLRAAGIGVAVANAYPEVRAAADYVTASNEEDGVAQALEKLILNAPEA